MSDKMISLLEFAEAEKRRIERFVRHYSAQMNDPSNMIEDGIPMYPNLLPVGEWDEQFRVFEECEDTGA